MRDDFKQPPLQFPGQYPSKPWVERVEWDLAEPVAEWLLNVVSGTLNGTLPIEIK